MTHTLETLRSLTAREVKIWHVEEALENLRGLVADTIDSVERDSGSPCRCSDASCNWCQLKEAVR